MTGRLLALLLAGLLAVAPARAENSGAFSFAVIGDAPYNFLEEILLRNLLASLDREKLAFIVHVGDIKSGSSLCLDELYRERRQLLDASAHPVVFVPGDNDWTDCHRESNGGYDPRERLDMLRIVFYPSETSLGSRPMALERQSAVTRFSDYRENQRWRVGPYRFLTLNIPGSNNNLGRSADGDAEHHARMSANRAWLAETFRLAKTEGAPAVFVIFHANPRFERFPMERRPSGYRDFLARLEDEVKGFGGPVVAIHGDFHQFLVDRPFRDRHSGKVLESVTRIQSYGTPALGWVRVTVDPGSGDWLRTEGIPFPPQP
jgi:hypothetical protein